MEHRTHWPPALAGAGIGLLNAASMATSKRPLGVTTAFEDAAALLAQKLAPRAVGINRYLTARADVPKLGWEMALAVGIFAGSALSAALSGSRRPGGVPPTWRRRFGPSPARRHVGAFLGGALMMFGARMAKGCTSGHGLSGNMQLSLSSAVFTPLMFASAIATRRLLLGKEPR
jgi:uncharacterized membrane protein YedE/YeeE